MKTQTKANWSTLLVVAGLSVLLAPLGLAQITGSIQGTVSDATGAVLPGVEVVITNVATSVVRTALSNESGRYNASNIPSGAYTVRAELPGFQAYERSGVNVAVGRTSVIDVQLQVGEVSQTITVAGDAPLLETTTATVSAIVDERKVLDLPLNNRDLTQLTFLQPGVVKIPQRARQGVFSGMGDKFSVAGARQSHNIYLLDGVSNSDLSGNSQGASGSYIGAETIKEFNIITNNYSAEFESKAGAIVSAVSKSGTNAFHGSLFWFLRNDNIDATNFFDNKANLEKPEFKRNQYGFSLGGPIVKDRTFFFTSFEGLRERLGLPDIVVVPTRFSSDPNTVLFTDDGESITAVSKIQPYLALYPTVDAPGVNFLGDAGDGTSQIGGLKANPTDDDFFSVKVDHELGGSGSLSGHYNWSSGTRQPCGIMCDVSGSAGDGTNFGIVSSRHVMGLRHTAIVSPTSVNEFHFGFAQTEPGSGAIASTLDTSSLAFFTGDPDSNSRDPERVGQWNTGGDTIDMGFRTEDATYQQKSYAFNDNFTLTRGNHSMKMGGNLTRYTFFQESFGQGTNGIYSFRSLQRFLEGTPRRFDALLPDAGAWRSEFAGIRGNDPGRRHNQWAFAAFFQDDWKMSPNFNLNLGLRWEMVTVPEEQDGKDVSMRSILQDTVVLENMYRQSTTKSFSPRLGFAWGLGNTTTLRGGVGIFYVHPQFYHSRTSTQAMPPYSLLGRADEGSRRACATADNPDGLINFPNAFQTQLFCMLGRPGIRPMQYQMETMYQYRWSMTLQQQIGQDWVASIGYTGSRALHLIGQNLNGLERWEGFDLDNPPVGAKVWPFTLDEDGEVDTTGGSINSSFGDIRFAQPQHNSFFHGLAVGLQKRFSDGLSAQFSYNWQKNIDQGSGVTSGGDNLPQTQRGIYGYDTHLKRGLSSHHIGQAFTTNISWEIPGSSNLTGAVGQVVNGWQINTIATFSDGPPLSIEDINDLQTDIIGDEEALRVDLIPGGNTNPILGGSDQYYDVNQFLPSTLGRFGTLGRNTLIGPGIATVDLSLTKDFSIGETSRIQFRAEFFNIANRANFGDPRDSPFRAETADGTGLGFDGEIVRDPRAGQITRTVTKNREVQFGLKFIF